MSFKSREKKRRRRIAVARVRAKNRETMAERHYLTVVSRHCCCNSCGGSLRAGRDDCVYRHTPREILCLRCATDQQIRYRTSRKWDQRKVRELQRKAA
jgi:hypothetical protein